MNGKAQEGVERHVTGRSRLILPKIVDNGKDAYIEAHSEEPNGMNLASD